MEKCTMTPRALRALCRSGEFSGPTSGYADNHVQANMMIVPREYAFDLLLFCQRNPKPCPLVEVLDAGQTEPRCAPGADIRTDLPGYRIYEQGALVDEVADISPHWRDDFVTFLLGCSFSFENALIKGGVPLRHVEQGRNVAMYRTNVACQPAGRLHGNLVVSMRPIRSRDVARAVEISARFPQVHGAPVHVGHPGLIGISDLARPDYGDAVDVMADELPLFWACGVTPQAVVQASRIPFCISHSPGKMLVTDLTTG
ncbi:MAG: putative hydro-lyase [Rhodocyclales bacterium]|nr:putative hydro-lyase [Rhodocyclales bacterium]